MKTTIYIKKEIKTEDDLPENNGWYFCYDSSKGYLVMSYNYSQECRLEWFERISWYLLPIELELPEDEEIHDKIEELIRFHGRDNLIYIAQSAAFWLRDNIKEQLKIR